MTWRLPNLTLILFEIQFAALWGICNIQNTKTDELSKFVKNWSTFLYSKLREFESGQGLGIFLFTTASRPALGPTQPPVKWVPGALSQGVKRPGCEAHHSHPSSAGDKECVELYLHSLNTPSWRDARLKHMENFTFFTFTSSKLNYKDLACVKLLHSIGVLLSAVV
jgi:hypothetical protein